MTKQADPENSQQSLLFQIDYPGIVENIRPKYRVMAAYEQHIEPPDKAWQYLLFAAEPYETIGFKIPSREVCTMRIYVYAQMQPWTHYNILSHRPECKFFNHSCVADSNPNRVQLSNGISCESNGVIKIEVTRQILKDLKE